jgi:hypothetical protein
MSSPANDTDLPGRDDNRASGIVASATLLWVLGASLVALRFYVRTKIVRVFGIEDWTLLVALVSPAESNAPQRPTNQALMGSVFFSWQ